MDHLFSTETRLYKIMSKLSQFIGLNLLTFLCSLPVLTVGASFSACHKVMHDMLYEAEGDVIKPFFRAFKSSFKQATLVWVVYLAIILVCMFNIMMIDTSFSGTLRLAAYIIVVILLVLCTALYAFLIPLISRYQNTLKEHLTNSLVLTLCNPIRALIMALLNSAMALMAYMYLLYFLKTLVFWILFGISLVVMLDTLLIKKIYRALEENQS